jgi:hypothetical protein
MARLISPFCFLMVACSLGCDSVVVDGRFGEPLSQAATSTFTGRWINEESEVVDVRLLADNRLILGSLSWDKKKNAFAVQNHTVEARLVGGVTYFLLGADDDDAYGFVRIERIADDAIKMLSPDPEAFRTAVKNGKIDGQIVVTRSDHFSVVLESRSPLNLQLLSNKESAGWYKADETQIIRRIKQWPDNH